MTRPTPEQKAAVLASYAAGLSSNLAARTHGVSPSTAHKWVHAAGIARTLSGAKAKERERREAAYEAEYGLGAGRWVPNARGVQVWREAA